MNSYVSLDLETTGLSLKLDKIIEIGAGRFLEVSSHIKECSNALYEKGSQYFFIIGKIPMINPA